MKKQMRKILLCPTLLCAGMLRTVHAEEEPDVCFAAVGVTERESSVHALYPEDGETQAYVSLWQGEMRVLKGKVTASRQTHVSLHAEPLSSARGEGTVAVTAGFLKATSASLGMGTDRKSVV